MVNNNLSITADETGGLIADGTYDWIEVLGATTTSYCPEPGGICTPEQYDDDIVVDGEEWSLAIFSDTGWFTDGGAIPAGLPATYTAFLIGIEADELGNEIGLVIAPIETLTVTAIPIPAAVWLFGSGLGLLGWMKRKRA